jgi:heat shock 70kDa protein 1/2/6/8
VESFVEAKERQTSMAAFDEVSIGIDLGTTYSCVGVWQNDRVEIIANDQGNRTTPSYVAFTDQERIVGDAAKTQSAANAVNTVFDVKRLIGRKFSDAVVQSDMKHWPFTVLEGPGGKPMIQVTYKGETKQFSAEEISAMILNKMKEIAEAFIGSPVKNAVISESQPDLLMNSSINSSIICSCSCILQRLTKTCNQRCRHDLWHECLANYQ